MNYLALDLGTVTGFACGRYDTVRPSAGNPSGMAAKRVPAIASGVWNLKPKRSESPGMRAIFLKRRMDELYSRMGFTLIGIEEVNNHKGIIAAHIYGGLLMTIQAWAAHRNITVASYGVGEIKKFWTGTGTASKDRMIVEAISRGFPPEDDNEADALALLHLLFDRFGDPPRTEKEIAAAGLGISSPP